MAREVRRMIVFPVADNDGKRLDKENEAIRRQLAKITGGFTERPGARGSWYSEQDGKRYEEEVSEVYTTNPRAVDSRVKAQLPAWRDLLRQQALYSDAHEVENDLV